MSSTQIATTSCRSITKLVVSIGSGETHITYADETARSFCANPSWFTFRGGVMDLSLISEPIAKDYPKEAAAFLERHFGKRPTVRASEATHQRLVSMQLNALVANSEGDFEEVSPEAVVWHTWLLEEVKPLASQRAVITEWIEPATEALRIFNRSWHLQNCMAWRLIVSQQNDQAKCYCRRIKRFMDSVNNFANLDLQEDESLEEFTSSVPELTEKVLDATDVLKQLNELLDLQEKRNRRYQRQLK